MDITITIADRYNVSFLDLLETRAENVIMLINYTLEGGGQPKGTKPVKTGLKKMQKAGRVLVNEKTATGGWY